MSITDTRLPYKNDIYEGSNIIDKWHKVWILYSWFCWMKYLVDDQFNDINVVITNNKKDINWNIINTNQKMSKPVILYHHNLLPTLVKLLIMTTEKKLKGKKLIMKI